MDPLLVAAGILIDSDRVLVARRRAGGHLGGLWEFPGGKVHTGESVPQALVRELREELGIEVEARERWGILQHQYPEREVCIHFHFAHLTSGTPQPHEAEELRWATPAELGTLLFPAADRPLVDDLIRCHREGIPLHQSRHTHPGNGEDIA